MKAKIWIITPYASMKESAEEIIREKSGELISCDFRVSTSHTDISGFQNSLVELKKAEEWGAEAIISRGGTASYIAGQTDIPVVEIQVTALDILQAFRKSRLEPSEVGIAGSGNITYECETLYDFLGIQLRQITLQDDEDYQGMRKAASDGIKALVGDAVAIRFAASAGMPVYLIESGKASIYKAVKEAEAVVKVRRKEQSRAELLRTIIDTSVDGIVAIDDSACITLMNKVAESMFHTQRDLAVGVPVEKIITNTRLVHVLKTGEAEIGEVQMIGLGPVATKRIPIKAGPAVTGVVATFQEVAQLQKFEQSVRQNLHEKGLTAKFHINQIIGCSPAIEEAKFLARTYAGTDSTVLIAGESGTGKELFAQSIHNLSPRRSAPFVAVNCAALPENLLESELFGYEEGSFTGARKGGKMGLAELAHGGTLFLDEVAEMPLSLQARILRMIQEKEVMRLGGHKIIPVNVRILCATNQDLAELVDNKKFREDLYYRLDVLSLKLPPLRERPEDIGLLADYFISRLSPPPRPKSIGPEALQALSSHYWPGNVRELANVLERLVLLSPGPTIDRGAVEKSLKARSKTSPIDPEARDPWALVKELRNSGLGARKIAKILALHGHSLKYYQIAYRLDKEPSK